MNTPHISLRGLLTAGLVVVGGGAVLTAQTALDKSLSSPCSPHQKVLLKEVDMFIVSHREKIAAWYEKLCADSSATCEPFPENAFDVPIRYHCFPKQNSKGPVCFGRATVRDSGPSLVTLSSKVFDIADGEKDLCFLVNAAFHERVHIAIRDGDHTLDSEEGNTLDSAYAAGNAAELVCIDANSFEHADTVFKARKKKAHR